MPGSPAVENCRESTLVLASAAKQSHPECTEAARLGCDCLATLARTDAFLGSPKPVKIRLKLAGLGYWLGSAAAGPLGPALIADSDGEGDKNGEKRQYHA